MGHRRKKFVSPWHFDPCTLWGYWKAPPLPEIDLDELCRTMRDGDILLFRANGLYAWMEDFWTDSTVSHVAMGLRHPDTNEPLVVEATLGGERARDVRTKRVMEGPMIVPLAERVTTYLQHYGFDVRYRPLCPGERTDPQIAAERRRVVWDAMDNKLRENVGFDSGPLDLMAANAHYLAFAPTCCWWPEATYNSRRAQFCSSLVAEQLQATGIMRPERPFCTYAPKDFAYDTQDLLLDDAACYGHEFRVVYYV